MTDPTPNPDVDLVDDEDPVARLRAEILAIDEASQPETERAVSLDEVHAALGRRLAPDDDAMAAVEQLLETPPAGVDVDTSDTVDFRFRLMDTVDAELKERRLLKGRIEPILQEKRIDGGMTIHDIAAEVDDAIKEIDVTPELIASLEDGRRGLPRMLDDVVAEIAVLFELEVEVTLAATRLALEANAANTRIVDPDTKEAFAGLAPRIKAQEVEDRLTAIAARMKLARERRGQ